MRVVRVIEACRRGFHAYVGSLIDKPAQTAAASHLIMSRITTIVRHRSLIHDVVGKKLRTTNVQRAYSYNSPVR